MKLHLSLALAASLLVSITAQAQQKEEPVTVLTAQADPKIDPARLAAAERLLKAVDNEGQMRRTFAQMRTQQKTMLAKSIQTRTGRIPEPGLLDVLDKVLAEHLEKRLINNLPNISRAIALIYAKNFTAAELDHLATIQSDPVIKQFNAKMPQMMSEMMMLVSGINDAHSGELRAALMKAINEYEAKKKSGGSS